MAKPMRFKNASMTCTFCVAAKPRMVECEHLLARARNGLRGGEQLVGNLGGVEKPAYPG
jgi:hypothetical protein